MDTIKTIVISGYYGFDNSGDDAILKAILKGFKDVEEKLNIIVLSNDPPSTEKIYGIKAVDRFKMSEVRKTIKSCDLFISGGGSLLQDITSTRSLIYYIALMQMAKFYKKKVMVYSNGVGPIDRKINRLFTKKILEKVDLITLRDDDSKEFIRSMGVKNKNIHVTADPVFCLDPVPKEKVLEIFKNENIPLDKELIGIAVRDWKDCEISIVENLGKASEYMNEKYNANIILIPMHYPEDLDISRKILEISNNKNIYLLKDKYSVDVIMGVIKELEMILAMRLHSLIYAATQEVPMLGIVYDPKIVGFLNLIKAPNMVDVENMNYEELIKNIDEVWSNRENLKNALREQDELMKNKALENINLALELLKV